MSLAKTVPRYEDHSGEPHSDGARPRVVVRLHRGGILGANALLGDPFSKEDAVNFATSIEGHPDNVAPAILGGFVVSAL